MGQMYELMIREAHAELTPARRKEIEAAADVICDVAKLTRGELWLLLTGTIGGSPWAPKFQVESDIILGSDENKATFERARFMARALMDAVKDHPGVFSKPFADGEPPF